MGKKKEIEKDELKEEIQELEKKIGNEAKGIPK